MEKDYFDFLKTKEHRINNCGIDIERLNIHPILFDWQKDIVTWACRKGRCAVFLDTGLGKALDSNTLVITPNGKIRIADIKVGDNVIGQNGKPTKVIGVYPQGLRPAYKVTFSDDSSVICDDEHLWNVRTKVQKYRGYSWQTKTLHEIRSIGLGGSKNERYGRWFIPMVEPVEFNEQELPLHPYLLGCLLGDGCLKYNQVGFSTADIELVEYLKQLTPFGIGIFKKRYSKYDYVIGRDGRLQGKQGSHLSNPMIDILNELGVYGHGAESKFIPNCYKYSLPDTRLFLLRGLLDTDGSVWDSHGTSVVEYCTVSKQLAEDCLELIQSLGGRGKIKIKKTNRRLAYRIIISLPKDVNPFLMARKVNKFHNRTKYLPSRSIRQIEQVSDRDMTCIKVDANDGLFVIDGFIVTHNTFIQLEWARLMGENTLIVAPLSVARQTVREAKKIDLDIKYVRGQKEITGESKIWITNYEMADQFDYSYFNAIVLEESSILKSIGGKTRQKLTELCANIKYRLCCTATPAPNDYIELGNHTEFLGICKQSEMLAMFFINANKEHTIVVEDKTYRKKGSNKNGTEWRLKHHAEQPFFKWLSSWAITMSKPSDLGYSDNGFILPKLTITPIYINSEYKPSDQLFFTHLHGITDRTKVRKTTIDGKKIALYSLLNLWYNNSNEYANVLETILPSTQGETIEASEGQDKKLNSNPKSRTQGIHEIVSSTQHNKVETYSRATAESQRPQEGIILSGRNTKNNSTEKGARLGKRTSRYEAQPTIEEIQNQPSGLYNTNGEARQPLRNMQDTIKQPQDISVYRPLPQDRESEGVIVRELQPRIRQNEGLTGTAKDGCPIPRKQLIIWCGMDAEQRVIENICKDLKLSHSSVYGSLSADEKEKRIESWLNKETLVLISKPKICGFGLNLQQSHRMIFFGINDSWEVFYQCIRREWRYGQPSPVDVYLIIHEAEAEIHQNILRKDAMAKRLKEKLIEQIKVYEEQELGVKVDIKMDYTEKTIKTDNYTAMLGDSCERLKEIPENSIDLSVYSPPFGDLFVYSSSDRDLGNSKDWGEFFEHYKYVIREILRVTKQGRLTCVHTSDIPAMAQRDGYIGIRDFPGEVIRAYEKEGWVFVGRAFVPKNPQAQAIRTHSSALLFVSLRRDSSDSRPALIDQILLFKKDGENQVPVLPVKNGEIDNETWIKWANGVWDGISESDTLQFSRARGVDDEKHICPLQLGTIERCIKLYSNPNEMVLDPFNGIGSTGYMALKLGRKYTGIELKREYFDIAINNLKRAVNEKNSRMLI